MVKKEKKQSTKKETKVDQKKIQELEDHVKELEASLLYSKAEAENARKRSLEDIEKARKFAVEKFAKKYY
jgi:molecular chaperone GrpE